jgi:hypothetical protein
MQGIPFITYFPAIVLATLLGGFWPGVLATILSGLLAWVVFIPPGSSLRCPSQKHSRS